MLRVLEDDHYKGLTCVTVGVLPYTCCRAFGSGAVTFYHLGLSRPGIESRSPACEANALPLRHNGDHLHNFMRIECILFDQTWIPFTQGCFVQSLIETGPVAPKKRIFKISSMYFRYVGKGHGPSFQLIWIPLLKEALFQVWLKLDQWFRRTDQKCEKLTTTTTTTIPSQFLFSTNRR